MADSKPRRPPAKTREGRENQLIALAVELAEKQLREGRASSQVITHYLKLGTSREQLEQEKLRLENELAKAKTLQIANAEDSKIVYKEALEAMRTYSGNNSHDD